MDAPIDMDPGFLDQAGTVISDLACRRCGYNLRGLNNQGRCPECGAAIGLSCHGDLLRFADPKWVETLGRGASLILWGVLASVVGGGLSVVLAIALGDRTLAILVALAGSAMGLYGAWLITSPDPSGIGEDKYVNDRKIVRFALLVGVAGQVLEFAKSMTGMSPKMFMIAAIAGGLASIVAVVGEFAKLTYFRKIALRIPDDALADRAKSLRWVMAISLSIVLVSGTVAGILTAFAGRTAGPVPTTTMAVGPGGSSQVVSVPMGPGSGTPGATAGIMAFGCVTAVAGLVYLIVEILILILVSRLRRAFREQAALARDTWARANTPAVQGP